MCVNIHKLTACAKYNCTGTFLALQGVKNFVHQVLIKNSDKVMIVKCQV